VVRATSSPPEQAHTRSPRRALAAGRSAVPHAARKVLHALHPPALGELPFLRNGGGPAGAADARPSGHRWPFRSGWVDAAWVVFSAANLCAMWVFSHWETVPFHFIWISLTILYGFRVWALRPTLWVLIAVMVTTAAVLSYDVRTGAQSIDELNEVPLMAAMFWAMVWHARRRLAAEEARAAVSVENARLLATQRRFLQDASHQLRTPITIALGHAELLASELAGSGRREERDIQVVVGELARLRRLGERLLMIAAAEDPDFLRPEPVALDRFTMEVLRKWMPTAPRRWQLGRLDAVMVDADRERLGLAVDALLENAVRHTGDGDMIELSVLSAQDGQTVGMVIADSGAGIPPAECDHIFDRFRSGPGDGGGRSTGLGLALVRAVARAHGGEVLVRSTPGEGSEFELVLPVIAPFPGWPAAAGQPGSSVPAAGTVPAGAPSAPAGPARAD
jgi:signal transduction histidine kinase